MAATKSIMSGHWKEAYQYLSSLTVWNLIGGAKEPVLDLLKAKLQVTLCAWCVRWKLEAVCSMMRRVVYIVMQHRIPKGCITGIACAVPCQVSKLSAGKLVKLLHKHFLHQHHVIGVSAHCVLFMNGPPDRLAVHLPDSCLCFTGVWLEDIPVLVWQLLQQSQLEAAVRDVRVVRSSGELVNCFQALLGPPLHWSCLQCLFSAVCTVHVFSAALRPVCH